MTANRLNLPAHRRVPGLRAALACLAASAVLAGCATTAGGGGGDPAEVVKRRAEERYQAMIDKNFRKAYEYLSPAYRQSMPFISHHSAHRPLATYVSAKVLSVQCPSDSACDVEIEVGYRDVDGLRFKPKGTVTSVYPERWVKVDGQWWLHFRR
ncbi:MAG: hypothetical protein AB7L76_21355 [Burkholderiaceae bacterium]